MIVLIKKIINILLRLRINHLSNRKLRRISLNVVTLKRDKSLEKKYIDLWGRLGERPSLLFLNVLSSIQGNESYKYVPENIHYGIIEPILNNKAYALTFNDKNFFERYLQTWTGVFPLAVLRGNNGVVQDVQFKKVGFKEAALILEGLNDEAYFILKPATETGGGDNVLLIKKDKSIFLIGKDKYRPDELIEFLRVKYNNNFILQHKILQHKWFEDFNETSVNTVRLYTYRSVKNESIYPLHAYVRFGNPGSIVDSSTQGGQTCGISKIGLLNDFALGKYGEKIEGLDCVKNKKGTKVPFYKEMKMIAGEIAKSYYYHRLLGFDFYVDKDDNVKLLEINTLNIGIINQQMNNGPLFGDFIDEVIDYCNAHKKSIVLDFYI